MVSSENSNNVWIIAKDNNRDAVYIEYLTFWYPNGKQIVAKLKHKK